MLLKGDVEIVQQLGPGFYSCLFQVQKVTGGWRSVIDLLSLNNFVTISRFWMETVSSVLASVRRGGWMFSVDLQDAYFQIPFHQESRPYLRFCIEGCVYQFKVLCFALSMALQVFTRVFVLVLEWVHWRGVCLLHYLDDWLVVAESWDLLCHHQAMLLQLCSNISIVVNWKNSDLVSTTRLQYLGMILDTTLDWVFPSKDRLLWFRESATSFFQLHHPPAHLWQRLLGHMSSLECFLPGVCTRMRPLQWQMKDPWSPVDGNPSYPLHLSWECVQVIRWWLDEDRWTRAFLFTFCPRPCRYIQMHPCWAGVFICWTSQHREFGPTKKPRSTSTSWRSGL